MDPKQLETLIPESSFSEFARQFLQEFLRDGFGASTKRGTELFVFHLLEEHGNLSRLGNTEISHLLQMTESRVKSFRYESKLRFPPKEDKYIERRILWALAMSDFDGDSKRIRFVIEDPYVQKALAGQSKRMGGVPDTSFNSEVVSLRPDQLLALIRHYFGEDIAGQYEQDFAAIAKEDSKIKFAELRKNVVLGAAKSLGSGLVTALKGYLTGSLS